MIKHFCDVCGDEITEKNRLDENVEPARLRTTLYRNGMQLGVEVITVRNGTANSGEFCKYCVLDALYKLDDRPQSAQG